MREGEGEEREGDEREIKTSLRVCKMSVPQ